MADLIIRAVRPEDYEQWLPLWDGYNAFYGRSGPTALAPEITRTTWERFFDAQRTGARPCRGAGRTASSALSTIFITARTTTIDLVCYLNDLFTSAAARGKGVGRALIQAVYDEARRAGSPRVYWHTHETNATARLLYDKVADDTGFIFYRKQF